MSGWCASACTRALCGHVVMSWAMAGRVVLGRAVGCCDECDLGLGVRWVSEKLTAWFASRVLQGCRVNAVGRLAVVLQMVVTRPCYRRPHALEYSSLSTSRICSGYSARRRDVIS